MPLNFKESYGTGLAAGGKDCMEGDDGAPKIRMSIAICESGVG